MLWWGAHGQSQQVGDTPACLPAGPAGSLSHRRLLSCLSAPDICLWLTNDVVGGEYLPMSSSPVGLCGAVSTRRDTPGLGVRSACSLWGAV